MSPPKRQSSSQRPEFSVVVPFYNEEDNLETVCREVIEVMNAELSVSWELVMVNDGSKDKTGEIMDDLSREFENLRAIHVIPNSGQSAALQAGFIAARGKLIGTLDGDGQNDPRDLVRQRELLEEKRIDMMCGIRQKRADNFVRKASSRIANKVRAAILSDNITDVGCSTRVFKRNCMLKVPLFRNSHRYYPALFKMRGYSVEEMPVNHRSRMKGESKYGGGIHSRLWVGIVDLMGVYWLKKRGLKFRTRETRE